MREIKFRGKRLDNGEWIFGSLLNLDGECEIADCNTVDYGRYEVAPATVGQYTGLKDKNGKEIWEGDILTDKFESIGVVEWRDGALVVNFGDVDVFQIVDCFDDSYQMWTIGNIYDNPELLKTE
jgi:uncharacterized phage protein (TIGR01671 family)